MTHTPCCADRLGDRGVVLRPSTAPVGMAGLISSTAAVCGPIAAASSAGSVAQPAGPACSARAGAPAGQPDPVHQPGVDRVADDHLLARLDGGQQHVQDAVEPAGHADALRVRVVATPADRARHGRPPPRAARSAPGTAGSCWPRPASTAAWVTCGRGGRRDVGVQVLQPEEPRVAGRVGRVADLVHTDPRDVPEPA